MRRWLLFFFVLAALPVVTVLVLINGGQLTKLTNLDPGVFEMKFRDAKWKPPFGAEVHGLELMIQSEGNRVRVGVESATTTFDPMKLLEHTIAFDDTTASGVTVAVQLPEPADGTPVKRLPPMDDFAPPNREPQPIWNVLITDLKDTQVTDVWIDGFHYAGEMVASGGFGLVPKQQLTVFPARVVIDGGVLTMPNGLEAKLEPSEVNGEIRQMPLEIPMQPEMLRAVDADVKLRLHAPNLNYFNTVLLKDLPDVRIERGAGAIAIDVGVTGGVVTDGSAITIARREIGVQVPFFDIAGQAAIDVKARGGKAIAHVSLPEFEITARDGGKLVANGRTASLFATVNTLDLKKVRDVDVFLKLEHAAAKDIAFLDRFVPAGSGVVLIGGIGVLSVEADLSTHTQKAKGKLSLQAANIQIQNRSARISGAAEVIGVLNSFDLRKRNFDIAGSSIKFRGVNVVTRRATYKNVTLSAVAPRALFAPDSDHPVQATMAIGVSNLQPLMGIMSANIELPDIIIGLLNIPDVAAAAEIDVRKNEVKLKPIALTARALRVDAQVVLNENAKKETEPHGVALVRAGLLSIGLGIDGGAVTPMLFGAPEWYGKQVDAGVP